jgi:hypothetical protein
VVQGSSGSLASPGYPNTFASNLNCLYKIIIPAGHILKLTFVDFNLKEKKERRCSYSDYLMMNNTVSGTTLAPTVALCGSKIPAPVYSKSNWIKLKFHSFSSNQFRGFNITFEGIIENDGKCNT